MIPVEEAIDRILRQTPVLPSERIPIDQANGRYLARALVAPVGLPLFDNSAMDGYAVRRVDLTTASTQQPIALKQVGVIPAGEPWTSTLAAGQCLRIFTGSAIPAGTDAVVMQEETRPGAEEKTILFSEPVMAGENIRPAGEEIKAGSALLEAGRRIHFGMIGLLGAVGLKEVEVIRRPRICLLATGNELLEPGGRLSPGKIYESNRAMLAALSRQVGAEVSHSEVLADSPEIIAGALQQHIPNVDLIISCGGVSVGDFDFMQESFRQIGGSIDFWKVSMRPGKPFLFGKKEGALFFGLPGNPVSAAMTFLVLVLPALQRMQGGSGNGLRQVDARLQHGVENPAPRTHFMNVRWVGADEIALTGRQVSHWLSSLANAEGFMAVPPKTNWPAGKSVQVSLFPAN